MPARLTPEELKDLHAAGPEALPRLFDEIEACWRERDALRARLRELEGQTELREFTARGAGVLTYIARPWYDPAAAATNRVFKGELIELYEIAGARSSAVAAPTSRILEALAAEGDTVAVGQPLVQIEITRMSRLEEALEAAMGLFTAESHGDCREVASGLEGALAPLLRRVDIVAPAAGRVRYISGTWEREGLADFERYTPRGVAVAELETAAGDRELYAPATGKVVEVLAARGDAVAAGQVLLRMEAAL
jgi:biotin carboxyl carrier protein